MWLVAGLGNPGRKYSMTRHNLGFMVIDEIARRWNIRLIDKGLYEIGEKDVDGTKVVLLKPLTYMNRSGIAIKEVCERYGLPSERLIVIHDDIDMETGKLRLRHRGSSGGHRGVQSIIDAIGEDFKRIKIGVGRDKSIPTDEYVLMRFRDDEMPVINGAIERAIKKIVEVISCGD